MPGWTVGRGRALAVGCGLLAAGCTASEQYGALPTGTAGTGVADARRPSASASPAGTVEARIVSQYTRFWTQALPAAFAAPPARRASILSPVTTNPQLELLLHNMAALDASGEAGYGVNRLLGQTVERTADLSLVRGCLDSSAAGITGSSGRPRTRGPDRNAVRVNLKREPGGVWKVSAVTYPAGESC
jgi:hypothetical protein